MSRIIRSDISFTEGFMVIKVLQSNNDQLRKGDEAVISQLSGSACPVELLKRYLAMFKILPDSKDVIFKPISKGKGSCKLVGPDKPYSYSTIRGAFRRHLESLGVGPSKFGLHSLRSEWVTMAASNGVNDKVFRRHGRWKSLQAKDEYVDDNLEQRLEVSSFLGLRERSLVLFSCIISPNLVRLAQFFVSLYMPRIFSRQASLKKPI